MSKHPAAEQFVWHSICGGSAADFNSTEAAKEFGGLLPIDQLAIASASRDVSAKFLRTILLNDSYRKHLGPAGVQMVGAHIIGDLDVSNAELDHELSLRNSLIEGRMNLARVRTKSTISFKGCIFLNPRGIDLHDAHIDGELYFDRAVVYGPLDMDSIQVGHHVLMRNGGDFKTIKLTGAHIAGWLDIGSDSKVRKLLRLDAVEIGGRLDLDHGGSYGEIDLRNARIRNRLSFKGSTVTGVVDMDSIQVDDSISLGLGARFENEISLAFGTIGRKLDLGGGTFNSITLTGTKIGGELWPTSLDDQGKISNAFWRDGSRLTLRVASADAVRYTEQPLQNLTVDLDGFTYRFIESGNPSSALTKDFYLALLNRQPSSYVSAQPYEQLAKTLQGQGDSETADEIRYSGKEKERYASPFLRRLWMTILERTIKYGYSNLRMTFWIGVLVSFGAIVFRDRGEFEGRWLRAFGFSLCAAFPMFFRREKIEEVRLVGWVQVYYYLHRLLGLFFGTVLGAGLAGLTK